MRRESANSRHSPTVGERLLILKAVIQKSCGKWQAPTPFSQWSLEIECLLRNKNPGKQPFRMNDQVERRRLSDLEGRPQGAFQADDVYLLQGPAGKSGRALKLLEGAQCRSLLPTPTRT